MSVSSGCVLQVLDGGDEPLHRPRKAIQLSY
jgi:hypothetical protein